MHDATQASRPIYDLPMKTAAGEFCFVSAAARRIASFGASLYGSRTAAGAGSVLEGYDIHNLQGAEALAMMP